MSEVSPAWQEPAPGAGSSAAAAEQGATRTISPDATTGWAVLVLLIAQCVGLALVFIWYAGDVPVSAGHFDGSLVALSTLITNPVLVGLFWWAVRHRGLDAGEYLGLKRFAVRHFLAGLLAIAALAAVLYAVARLANVATVPTFQTDAYVSAVREGWLLPLWLAVVVVGPIGEEITFRGFLYRGWVRPGSVVTPILVLTLLWTAMHPQYDWFGMSSVFLTGLVLGWLRWLSGSTALTIVLHMLVNLEATIETLVKVGWFGT